MAISVERWAEHDVQDATYVALLDMADGPFARSAQQVQVQPPGSWPRHIRVNQQPRPLRLVVEIVSGDFNTAQRQLSQWFAPGTQGELEINEDGVAKVVDAVCLAFQRYAGSGNRFVATLMASDPRWRGVVPISSAQLLTASGQGWSVNNPGNCPVDDPVITLRPVVNKAAAAGYLYLSEVIVVWRAERPSGYYAVELTEGWAHDAEVAAGRSLANGNDVRVLVDGFEVPRWFGENAATDANSVATNVWANLSFSPSRTATLLNAVTAILPNAAGELVVSKGGTLGWPRQGALLVDDEVILYTGRTERNVDGKAAFTGTTRAARNTTAAAHSAAATCTWVEHRVQIVYGNTGAAAPDPRADLKPMLDLTSATLSNLRHEWLNFADETNPGRSAQWGRRIRTNDDQWDKILAPSGSPAANMTFEYQSGGAVSGKPVGNTWYRDFPTGTDDSGGNVASITRAISDTLGMWAYGIDGDGREIVLEKYAGPLASGSDSIAEPTNPVYRIEFWGFNQVIARRPDGTFGQSLNITATYTDQGAQVLAGSQPLECIGAIYGLTDAVGGSVDCAITSDTGADVPQGTPLDSATITTTAAGAQQAPATWAAVVQLQPATKYWLVARDATANCSWMYGFLSPGSGVRSRRAATNRLDECFDYRLLGRPAALATSFVRCDSSSYADNGDQITIDGVTVHLLTAGVPYVALMARQSVYRFVAGVLHNETTGQSVTVNAACGMSHELQIDIGAGTAVDLDDENATSIAAGIEYSDPDAKFVLMPGNNDLRFVEAGLASVNALVEGSPRWE